MAVLVAAWLVVSPFTIRYARLVQHTGAFMIGWLMGLAEGWDARSQLTKKDISPYFWPNGTMPNSKEFEDLVTENSRVTGFGSVVYIHRDPIDFRAGINSLAILVEQSMGLSPFFERSGFVLVLKALSEDRFRWPRREAPVVTLDTEQLRWLLDGIDLDAMVRHPVRQYEFVG